MKTITVFTPTFNRAHLLPRLYKSLLKQSNKDFIWMLIDDGSIDNTRNLVEKWISEAKIEIHYQFKENGGMHTGHNLAYANIKTELNVCIDSDDYMPKDGLEKILHRWNAIEDTSKIAGLIGLDADVHGNIIGTKIPDTLKRGALKKLYTKHKVTGDKKIVLKTEIVKQYPQYPEFPNERLVPLGVLYLMIGHDYDFIYMNEILCIVDYQVDGSSGTILKQYKTSPKGFLYARNIQKKYSSSFWEDLKNSIHIVSSSIFANDMGAIFKGKKAWLNIILFPFGVFLNLYIRLMTW
ncbi:glycosyltransferase family A protein [Aequorivita sp. SDUM287046]|uniref:Glycosyltransferase family A protein n=1 Tax=Aequorivita aurantiaca TaxID=3053356 RepID=A0ABT8DFG6_9FLAO|nr:glycosyltransferase family A protein [Aequorivita aurantiaca]MDN3723963.1 glycosyltransferase family A protein [Aequorivita aurantiaca]